MSLRTLEFEEYLNWFLQQTGEITTTNLVSLIDILPARQKALYKGAKAITFSAPIDMDIEEKVVEAATPTGKKSKRKPKMEVVEAKPKGVIWKGVVDLFKKVAGDALDLPDHLRPQDIMKGKGLTMTLRLEWRRQVDQDGGDLLSDVGYKMRHIEDQIDYEVETPQGVVRKNDFKPKQAKDIPWNEDTDQPMFDKLFPMMMKWLAELEKTGKIEP